MKILNTPIFQMPAEDKNFTGPERSFFLYAIREEEICIGNVAAIIERNADNRARILHEIAEWFRIEIVETRLPDVEKIDCVPYREILSDAIYNIDHFKIAEEILSQYEENINKVKAA